MLYLRKSFKKSEVSNFLAKSGYTTTTIKQILSDAGIDINNDSDYYYFKKCTNYVNFVGTEIAWKGEYEGARIKRLIISTVKTWPKSGPSTSYWNLYQIFSKAGYDDLRIERISPEYIAQGLLENEVKNIIDNGVQ